MSDLVYLFAFLVFLLAVLIVPAIGLRGLVRRVRSSLRKRRYQLPASLHTRLAQPDFAAVEAHFGVKLPEDLKVFHRAPLERGAVIRLESGEWDIGHMEPLDGESVRSAWPGCESYVAIANDGSGSQYLFDPKSLERGCFFTTMKATRYRG